MLKSGLTKIEEDVEIGLPEGTRLTLPLGSSVRFSKDARVPINDEGGIRIAETSALTLPDAAEIVLPLGSVVGRAMQFARTPFIASFQAGWLKINLATVHIYFGEGASGLERRKAEIRRLTELLAERAKSDRDAEAHLIALGDFNIVDREHATMEPLVSNGFEIPELLQRVPGTNVKQDKFYDQIAVWTGRSKRRKGNTHMRACRAGVFDFFDIVYRPRPGGDLSSVHTQARHRRAVQELQQVADPPDVRSSADVGRAARGLRGGIPWRGGESP